MTLAISQKHSIGEKGKKIPDKDLPEGVMAVCQHGDYTVFTLDVGKTLLLSDYYIIIETSKCHSYPYPKGTVVCFAQDSLKSGSTGIITGEESDPDDD